MIINITITINITVVVGYLCKVLIRHLALKNKIKVVELLCNYTTLSEKSVENICNMFKVN